MRKQKRPEPGQYVKIFDRMIDEHRYGTVEELLSVQFTYLSDPGGMVRFASYKDEWETDTKEDADE